MTKVTIDGREYELEQLSETARQQPVSHRRTWKSPFYRSRPAQASAPRLRDAGEHHYRLLRGL